MLRLEIKIISAVLILVGVSIGLFVFSSPFNQFSVVAQDNSKTKKVGGHTPGSNMLETAGDFLDPISFNTAEEAIIDPMHYLREFNYGRVSTLSDGVVLREFTLIASDNKVKEISPGIFYNVWTFNGTIPGPTLRATEGDLIRINFINNGSKFHTIHTHGIHKAEMDGVFEGIAPGGKFTYEFIAQPFGVFPYHCHIEPLEEHISHGLYGVYIIDPKQPRPPADEMVMMMNGYDTDFDGENNFYTVNGIPYFYMKHPIQIEKDRLVRIYLLNMLEFDPINNFHLHKTEFAEKGWMGLFFVKEDSAEPADDVVALNKSDKRDSYPVEQSNNNYNYSYTKDKINASQSKDNRYVVYHSGGS